jgi:hypothetical protein
MWLKTKLGITRPVLKAFTDHTGGLDYEQTGQEDVEVTVEGDVVERNGEPKVLGFRADEDLDKRQRADAEQALFDEYERAMKVQTSARLVQAFDLVVQTYNAALERNDTERCAELTRKLAQVAA